MRKICFILNPVSGKGRSAYLIPLIKSMCESHNVEYEIRISKDEKELELLSNEASLNDFTDIIAVGGDGTLREVLAGMYKSELTLGLIPAGTGNDFALSAGIPEDATEALQVILNGETRKIDLPIANTKPFINVLSWGIDGKIIQDLPKFKKFIKGKNSYLLSAVNAISRYKPIKAKIIIDGEQIDTNSIAIVAVGNGSFFGGGMKITPNALIDDGKLDVCIVGEMPRIKLLKFFPSVFDGSHISVESVEYYKCENIYIELANNDIPLNLDGDLFEDKCVNISLNKKGITFLVSKTTQ